MPYTFEDIKNKTDIVRNIELKTVLKQTGCIKDKSDKAKWHTTQGIISVTGQKFMNWTQGIGGGGAIDLIIHLKKYDFKTAVIWLSENLLFSYAQTSKTMKPSLKRALALPEKDDNKLPQVKNYLRRNRYIPAELINFLVNSGKLYADTRGNAVFLLLGKGKIVVGAELRGTTKKRWLGMAHGSKKDRGCFYVKMLNSKKMILCESAIDAVSCFALYPDFTTLSTSGVTPNPPWLPALINKGFEIYCGFDSDEVGDAFSDKMISFYPSVKRLRPIKHDWNEVLKSKFNNC